MSCMLILAGCQNTPVESTLAAQDDLQSSTEPESTPEPVESQLPDDAELLRALQAGWIDAEMLEDCDKIITVSECAKMLSNMIANYRPDALEAWKNVAVHALNGDSEREMNRLEGMMTVFEAAYVLGLGDGFLSEWYKVETLCGWDFWQEWEGSDDYIFENAFETVRIQEIFGHVIEREYHAAGYNYSQGACSKISGRSLFDCDVENATMHPFDPLTRAEAIHAVLRLSESMPEVYRPALEGLLETDWADPVLADAAALKDKILNSETTIVHSDVWVQGETYTGTAYYVSNDGDDNNDGTTPETAWATMNRVRDTGAGGYMGTFLKEGDAVFFRRGDTFYLNDDGWGFDYVTFSAYGEGPKPIISGSVKGMADPARWTLCAQTEDGGQIWQFDTPVRGVSGIFFDDNSRWGRMCMPAWDGTQYVLDGWGEPWTLEAGMKEDLDFFMELPLEGWPSAATWVRQNLKGPLYLRCDAGNPGEVFETIDIIQDISCVGCDAGAAQHSTGRGAVVDNLSVMYASIPIVCGVSGDADAIGTMVQNCEISYAGGAINEFIPKESEIRRPLMSGGAVLVAGSGHTVINNYIHDVDNKVFVTVANSPEWMPTENVLLKENVIDHCASTWRICNYIEASYPDLLYRDLIFENNYVLYTGYGWYTEKLYRTDAFPQLSCIETEDYANLHEGIHIIDNLFYHPHGAVFNCYKMWDSGLPTFSGNTVMQVNGGRLVDAGLIRTENLFMTADVQASQESLRELLQDETLQLELIE